MVIFRVKEGSGGSQEFCTPGRLLGVAGSMGFPLLLAAPGASLPFSLLEGGTDESESHMPSSLATQELLTSTGRVLQTSEEGVPDLT